MTDFAKIYLEKINEIKEFDFEYSINEGILEWLFEHGVENKLPLIYSFVITNHRVHK